MTIEGQREKLINALNARGLLVLAPIPREISDYFGIPIEKENIGEKALRIFDKYHNLNKSD